jgi:isochorismate hydrolase
MKECYFSPDTLEHDANEMITVLKGKHYHSKSWKLLSEKAALLVLDMQNYFLDPSSHAYTPSAPVIIPNINKLITESQKSGMEIIFTKHINDIENAKMMGKWWNDMIAAGSFEAEISEHFGREEGRHRGREAGNQGSGDSYALRASAAKEYGTRNPEPGTQNRRRSKDFKIIVKNQYDAFYGTELEKHLKSREVEQVIITGILTNLCCETTARSAFVRGFEVFFPIDATAAYNRDYHISTFRNLGYGFCPILTTSELIKAIHEAK